MERNYKMSNIDDILKYPKLARTDIFAFACERCGCCCRQREDILLMPLEVYKMSKHLQLKTGEFISTYCEWYEGNDSKFPVVRIKPREYRETCPLNDKGLCIVQSVKPFVCAAYVKPGIMQSYYIKFS